MIDIHTHILPCVDDGAQSMEEALELVKTAYSHGVTDIILTPHNMHKGQYDVHPTRLREIFEDLKKNVLEHQIPINLYLGNEIYLSSRIVERLQKGDSLTLNQTNYILFEFSMMKEYPDAEEVLYDIAAAGYKVILAHPERYDYCKTVDDILRYKKYGAQIQINASAITGLYGKKVQKVVFKLLKLDEVDYISSDTHAHRKYTFKEAYDIVKKKFGIEIAKKIFNENPKVLIG